MPVANEGQDPLYYGAYCTDPTFSSPECTANCAVKYMTYCGDNNLWQCGNTNRTHPNSCSLTDTTTSDSSTFWMVAPTKLAVGRLLPSTEPPTTQSQYIPTQWGRPQLQTLSISPTIKIPTSFITSPIPSHTSSTPSTLPTQITIPDSQNLSKAALSAIISIATILGTCIATLTLFATLYPDKARRGCNAFWKRAFCG